MVITNLRSRLEKLAGKHVQVDRYAFGYVLSRLPVHAQNNGARIAHVGDDCFTLGDGTVFSIAHIAEISGDIR